MDHRHFDDLITECRLLIFNFLFDPYDKTKNSHTIKKILFNKNYMSLSYKGC